MKKITVSAPGKLMLFGEHAVVYGRPCLVTAVDQRLSLKAEKLDSEDFILNAPDGTVEITAQGSKENIDAFIRWCQRGPERARVDKVETGNVTGDFSFNSFEVRYR